MKIVRINAIWCSGCLVMKKTWKKVEELYPNIEYINYDYDFDEDVIKKYNVGTLLPVTIFLDTNDNEITRLNGEKTFADIENIIKE